MDSRTKSALIVVLALGLMSDLINVTKGPLTKSVNRPAVCAIGKSVTTEFSSKDITCTLPLQLFKQ